MNFKKISNDLYFKASHHKFAKRPNDFDRGYMKISDWINDLCWYYMQKRKQLDLENALEFKELIQAQKKKVEGLAPSEYKDGLMKALDEVQV